jgi:hypothetical protein
VLNQVGDPIERHITQYAEHVSNVLFPYAGIWVDHILVRRKPGDPSFVGDDWMLFAGSHYTALIRVFQAFGKHREILRCCDAFGQGNTDPGLLLKVHDAVAGFWEHIGSAIDNLALCFEDAPCISMREGDGRKHIQQRYPVLGQDYNRRTQFIHSRLIPKGWQAESSISTFGSSIARAPTGGNRPSVKKSSRCIIATAGLSSWRRSAPAGSTSGTGCVTKTTGGRSSRHCRRRTSTPTSNVLS